MLWSLGTVARESGENCTTLHVSAVDVWTTVENRGMKIRVLTCTNGSRSPIHKPYNNYTKIS